MTRALIWEEPPRANAETQARAYRREVIAQLQAKPGVSAKLPEPTKSRTTINAWKRDGCEGTTRLRPDGLFDIYVWWPLPDPAEASGYLAQRRARGVPEHGRPVRTKVVPR